MNGNGQLMTIPEAARKAGITKEKVNSYIQEGHLPVHLDGFMVYYRDLLRASWVGKEPRLKKAPKKTPKYKQKKKLQ